MRRKEFLLATSTGGGLLDADGNFLCGQDLRTSYADWVHIAWVNESGRSICDGRPPPPLVLILKEVVCFVTVLQVLILKVDREGDLPQRHRGHRALN